jgi:hypothetical protein
MIIFFLFLSRFTVTHKVTAGAKAFGSFFSGVVNKAGDKIKETVKHNVSERICAHSLNFIDKHFFILSTSAAHSR